VTSAGELILTGGRSGAVLAAEEKDRFKVFIGVESEFGEIVHDNVTLSVLSDGQIRLLRLQEILHALVVDLQVGDGHLVAHQAVHRVHETFGHTRNNARSGGIALHGEGLPGSGGTIAEHTGVVAGQCLWDDVLHLLAKHFALTGPRSIAGIESYPKDKKKSESEKRIRAQKKSFRV